jgi:hypothetical protein
VQCSAVRCSAVQSSLPVRYAREHSADEYAVRCVVSTVCCAGRIRRRRGAVQFAEHVCVALAVVAVAAAVVVAVVAVALALVALVAVAVAR